ncbi:MAG: pyrroline-5-carboxylate reductase, partial [Myxococcales bacterium]|nr:pyrroline-5-carboxylate reductase [Myxococcales bacterium]
MGHERLKQLRIGVIGAGNMGTTILEGLLDAGAADPSQLMASDPREARRKELSDRGVKTTASNLEVARFAQLLVLATKPQVFDRMLAEIAPGTGPETLVVSIAAGIPIDAIETQLAPGTRVVRTMPNTPALVGAGATAIAPGAHVSEEDLATVEALFASVGITEVLDESLMDAVTGLSGSGPAFIFVIIDALSDAGVKVGLHRSTAQRLAAQTVLGAAKMLIETGEHPGQLKDMVASPGGT